MASLIVNPGALSIICDTGLMSGNKAVYRTVTLGGIKGSAQANDIAAVVTAIEPLLMLNPEKVTVMRKEILIY